MTEHPSSPRISRRSLLRGRAAAAGAGLPPFPGAWMPPARGAAAGLLPALRAARMSPTQALWAL